MKAFQPELVQTWQDLMNLATRISETGDLSKSEEILLKAYEAAKDTFGSENGNVGLVLLRLSEICHKQGKLELAHAYKLEIQRIIESYDLG